MQVQLKPRSVGEQLSLTFSLVMAHFGKLFLLMAILNVPHLWLDYMSTAQQDPSDPLAGLGASLASMVISMVTASVGTGACIVLVASSFTGQPIGLWQSVVHALRRFLGILGSSFVLSLVLAVGLLLLIVPFFIFMTWFYVVIAVLLVENKGVFASFARSRMLVQGHGWNVFVFAIVIYILTALIGGVGGVILGLSGAFAETGAPVNFGAFVAFSVITIIASLFATIGPVTVYFDLRVKKEAFDVQSLMDLVQDIGQRRAATGSGG